MKLTSDTILITGGTSGIGLEMAKQLMVMGNKVIVTGRDTNKLELFKKNHPEFQVYQLDISNPESVKELYDKVISEYPSLNMIINNAGVMRQINFLDTDISHVCDEIETNLNGPIRMVQQFLPHLLQQPEAGILNVTSGLSFIPFPKAPLYSASKSGLHAYTKVLRIQLKETSVKVFELAPPKTSLPLFGRDQNDNSETNRMPTMAVPKVIRITIKEIKKGKTEILPGLSKLLKLAGKIQL